MRPYDPFAYWSLGLRTTQMLFEAQSVIGLRVLGSMGYWPISPSENVKMVSEKGPAFLRAYGAAATAAMKGKRPDQIADAALRPIGRKTRTNSRRLTRRKR